MSGLQSNQCKTLLRQRKKPRFDGKPRLRGRLLKGALKHVLWRSLLGFLPRTALKQATAHPRLCARSMGCGFCKLNYSSG